MAFLFLVTEVNRPIRIIKIAQKPCMNGCSGVQANGWSSMGEQCFVMHCTEAVEKGKCRRNRAVVTISPVAEGDKEPGILHHKGVGARPTIDTSIKIVEEKVLQIPIPELRTAVINMTQELKRLRSAAQRVKPLSEVKAMGLEFFQYVDSIVLDVPPRALRKQMQEWLYSLHEREKLNPTIVTLEQKQEFSTDLKERLARLGGLFVQCPKCEAATAFNANVGGQDPNGLFVLIHQSPKGPHKKTFRTVPRLSLIEDLDKLRFPRGHQLRGRGARQSQPD